MESNRNSLATPLFTGAALHPHGNATRQGLRYSLDATGQHDTLMVPILTRASATHQRQLKSKNAVLLAKERHFTPRAPPHTRGSASYLGPLYSLGAMLHTDGTATHCEYRSAYREHAGRRQHYPPEAALCTDGSTTLLQQRRHLYPGAALLTCIMGGTATVCAGGTTMYRTHL
jgi:hypothetical protein